ncbi:MULTISPECIES: arabinosyltransferase domain-containing protein [Prauserella salsuginis group]|uniref:Arabinosyltransferase domain-containing protein n=1 Tax=Prauserella salsuginis TaxID=387889 RepID=A0ABW6FYE6_9PSEU|nr:MULTISPECIES: arabinosyltransferase domain-containing protein [Prauserella salsuginis group]
MTASATAPRRTVPRGFARRLSATVLGLLSALASVVFVLAPVDQVTTTYEWPSDTPEDTTLPLLPYSPQQMDVTLSCADALALGSGTLLSTTGPGGDQASPNGLSVRVSDGRITATLGQTQLATAPITDTCRWRIVSDASGTTAFADGREQGRTTERPAVNGLFTDVSEAAELQVSVTPDTRYVSDPSAVKIAAGVVSVTSLVAMLLALRKREPCRPRLLPPGWARPRPADGIVAATLVVWAVIGAATVDDGYIVTMILSSADTGFVGNYMRWFNAPEAPFSWFYELYRPWVEISTTTLWLRLPSLLVCLVSWLLIDRVLLPRFAKGRPVLAHWAAAAVFLLWTIQFGIGLRPEPWVMLGSLATLALVERGVTTRRLSLLACAVIAAGATTALTPTGIAVFLQLLVALPAAWPTLRAHGPQAIAVLLGAGTSVLLLMFYGQPLDTVLHAIEVRTEIGPSYGITGEGRRYEWLFDPLQGGLNRRLPVLLLWFAMAVLAVLLVLRRTPKLAKAPTRRLLIASLLYFAALALTPTKYTHHFGALAGVATLLVAVVVHAIARGALRRSWQLSLMCVALAVAVWVGIDAPLRWWFLGGLNVKWSEVPPGVAGIDAADLALTAGIVVAVAGLAGAWRWLRTPALFVPVVAFGVVIVEVGTMAYALVPRSETYTTGAANVAALAGAPCGIERWLEVEPDVAAGMLPTSGSADVDGFTTNGFFPRNGLLEPYGSAEAPVWHSGGRRGKVTTPWYHLPTGSEGPAAPPVVVPARGAGAVSATVEFADEAGRILSSQEVPLTPIWTEERFDPPTAAMVRLKLVDERSANGWIAAGVPRLPKTVPSTELVPASEPVILDWVGAFTMPCRRPPSVADGTVDPVRYRFASGPSIRDIGSVSYMASQGGPYAPLMQLATETAVPTYLRGDKLSEPISVFRLDYPASNRSLRMLRTPR